MSDLLGPAEWAAIALSLKVSFWATLASLPVALWVAYLLARCNFFGKQILNAAVHLPLILPPVVTGYVLLLAFGAQAPVGQALAALGLGFAFHWTGAALAAAVMAFPLMVRAMRLSLEAVDPKLEDAARSLGAPPWAVFARITLPLSLPGVLAGAILGFAKAMGNLAPPSPSFRIFQIKPAQSLQRFTHFYSNQAGNRAH